ncbi:Oidioi.mRNA.OKI2018_I69.PAR.g12446.t1.cds [Oikopleura dioica]|uniref:Oidioi.mRNA.OKI2018_I69.PAR.g12446.t1.cds n=1 Tax=Oikopleura dioica TaxID=34765 RepID=A0ABN7S4Z2_OIKDI|nr:Oidioi.mRNA.OKI2018_I69.PAR.g12446.t1.cds [Oikopleura dioica]
MENSERLSEAVEQAKLEQQVVIEKLNSKLKEYEALDNLLSTFTDKRVHEAMIPISKIAFCPGRFVNTNDITAYLGAEHFAVVSCKTARKLVSHRKGMIDEQILKQKQAADLVSQRTDSLKNIEEDLIKEELTEDDEKLAKTFSDRKARKTDEEIMEEIAEKLKRTKLRSDEEIWSEISGSSGTERKKNETLKTESKPAPKQIKIEEISDEIISPELEKKEELPKHNVHFDFDEKASSSSDSDPEPPLSLKFKFTNTDVSPKFSDNMEYKTPWDILNNHKKRKQHGILKAKSSVENTLPLQAGSSGMFPTQIPRIPPKRQNTAFGDDILERNVSSQTCKPPTKSKGSLFKQRRLRS